MDYQPDQRPKQCRQVNAYIEAKLGVNPDLVKGDGYFYFAELIPFESSVYVNNIGSNTFAEWLDEYQSLKNEGER